MKDFNLSDYFWNVYNIGEIWKIQIKRLKRRSGGHNRFIALGPVRYRWRYANYTLPSYSWTRLRGPSS